LFSLGLVRADDSGDLFDQRPRCADYFEGSITVMHGLSRHFGPRWEQAAVEITYTGQYALEFVSRADWPDGTDYSVAVRRGILAALQEQVSSPSEAVHP
jgi:hypothetical protein